MTPCRRCLDDPAAWPCPVCGQPRSWPAWDLFAAGVGLAGVLLAGWLAWGCSAPQVGCTYAYRYDGTTGPGARPYYLAESCPGQPTRVLCDSPEKLPTRDCRAPGEP